MNKNTYKNYISPVVVLVVICLVVSLLLAIVYGVAHPIIVKNTQASADAARVELLPEADAFTAVDGDLTVLEEGKVYVSEAYTANNGTGMVVTVITTSFGGKLTMMVGIDKDGAITGVKVTGHADTPGVGTKNWDSNSLVNGYNGLSELNSTNVKDGQVPYISGASVTGEALHKGVYCALEQQKAIGGGK